MLIAIAQIECGDGTYDANLNQMINLIGEAGRIGCDLVVFPEMSDLGYDMTTIVRDARPWSDGPAAQLSTAAEANNIAVVAGIAERDGDDVYNTLAILDEQGNNIAKYRKIHLITAEPMCEHRYLQPGHLPVLCDIGGIRCGFMTCYDIRFPELARALTAQGAEMLVAPSAFPLVRGEHWKTILSCRAIENQVYVAAPNRIGCETGVTFGGASRIIDPYGTILSSASEIDPALITAEIRSERVKEVRSRMRIQQDKQTELYKTWEEAAKV